LRNRNKYDSSEFDLLKLPIDILYSEALREIGEQESYIEELAYTIKNLQSENKDLKRKLELFEFLNAEERQRIENNENYLDKVESRKKLKAKIESLREDVARLICKLLDSQNEINSLREKLSNNK
jgi:predicted RNase H-like nuclease (RuvC/YqgF family)